MRALLPGKEALPVIENSLATYRQWASTERK